MKNKIPDDAFDVYVAAGNGRSYQAIADKYGVSKRAVTNCAKRNDWAERLEKIERESRENGDKKLTDTIERMRERHLATARAMLARALAALQQYPLSSGMDAMRAAEMAIKLERLVAGEATDRAAVDIEQIIRREYREWMADDDGDEPAVEVEAVP